MGQKTSRKIKWNMKKKKPQAFNKLKLSHIDGCPNTCLWRVGRGVDGKLA